MRRRSDRAGGVTQRSALVSTHAQRARSHLASLIRGRADPGEIEQARQALAYANAQQAVDRWLSLPLMMRCRLAAILLAGDDRAAT